MAGIHPVKRGSASDMGLRWAILVLAAGPLPASIACAASGATVSSAPRSGADVSLGTRLEIGDLLARYALYADANSGAAFASLFTEDGELVFEGRVVKGKAALARHIGQKTNRTVHLAGAPLLVQLSPTHVRVRSELIFMAESVRRDRPDDHREGGNPPSIGFSTYEDDIVLTAAGWKIRRREAGASMPLDPAFLPQVADRPGPTPDGS